jgi:hypothetical protein
LANEGKELGGVGESELFETLPKNKDRLDESEYLYERVIEESKYTNLDSSTPSRRPTIRQSQSVKGQMEFDSAMIARSGTISLHGYPDINDRLIESRATLLYKAGEAPPTLSKKQRKRNDILMDLQQQLTQEDSTVNEALKAL